MSNRYKVKRHDEEYHWYIHDSVEDTDIDTYDDDDFGGGDAVDQERTAKIYADTTCELLNKLNDELLAYELAYIDLDEQFNTAVHWSDPPPSHQVILDQHGASHGQKEGESEDSA